MLFCKATTCIHFLHIDLDVLPISNRAANKKGTGCCHGTPYAEIASGTSLQIHRTMLSIKNVT